VSATSLPPALVLVLGLVVVAVIVGSTRDLSPNALIDMTGGQSGLFPVGGAGGWASTPFSPFSPAVVHRSWALTIGLTIVYLGSVAALGSGIVAAVRGDDRWPRPVSALAGFLPGYLMLLAPLQVLFAAVPYRTAAWIALAGAPIAALLVHRRAAWAAARSVGHDGRRLGGWGSAVLVVGGAVVVALVHRLQVDQSFLTQDSINWFVVGGAEQLLGRSGSYLAQWDQQSDEWVFNAPLMFSSRNLGDLWFPFYVTQCVGIASFSALTFGIVHRLARRRRSLAGLVAVAVLFGLTPAIYPWLYVTVAVGGQPLLEMGHTGRFVGIVAPWVAVLVVGRQPRSVLVALGVATLGLGFVSVHALLYVLAAVGAVLVWRAARGRGALPAGGSRTVVTLLPLVVAAVFAGGFWWLRSGPTAAAGAWWLVAGSAIAVAGAVAVAAMTEGRAAPVARLPVWIGVAVAAVVVGLLLSNNMTSDVLDGQARHTLASVLPGYDGRLLSRTDLSSGLFSNVSFPAVSEQACLLLVECGGLAAFLAVLGLTLVLALVTWLALGPLTAAAQTNARRFALLLMLAALGVGLLVTFFTGGDPPGPLTAQAVIFTRFLEVPYYGLLALAALTFAESRSRATAITGTSVLALWTLIPVVATRRPEEWVRNAGWLLDHAGIV
jgi:hypothetical protein